MTHDSEPETREHIRQVAERLKKVCTELRDRGYWHDASKLGPNEKPYFDEATPKLKALSYGTDEYRAALREIKPALEHHYANNPHHPEHEATHEQWRDVIGYEGLYQVSSLGRVRSVARTVSRNGTRGDLTINEMIRKAYITPKGYVRVQLSKGGKPGNHLVHVLVAEAFIGPRPSAAQEVNHGDGIKSNNRVRNLEWMTPSENQLHAYENGLKQPNVKYAYTCEELDLVTIGGEKMVAECHKLGFTSVSAAGVWTSAMYGTAHAGFFFTAHPLVGDIPYSGIAGMDLLDLIEMYCDWAAAATRHADGDLGKSIEINSERFAMGDVLTSIFRNTFVRHGGFCGYQNYHLAWPWPEGEAGWTKETDIGTGQEFRRQPKPNMEIPAPVAVGPSADKIAMVLSEEWDSGPAYLAVKLAEMAERGDLVPLKASSQRPDEVAVADGV